ncbi:membrane-spanning 4-domains subfamily A member 4A isoform X5 [Ictalurus punctatus]|uniref:Membrane-spanning 4-domains subfamily A member 4A isoform X5 n=1 Tax=Ictalurus punctatus TaxID=7998 RepID=A0A979F4J2_ICTPU|nr:membrane-spanning 4-domains subfamily A member 4A isoform X5 [Ictalurus punctatus]
MASASIPLYNLGSGYTIVTQVLPSTVDQNSSQAVGPLQKFLKGEPKALGTVQIMNGIMILLLGIWLLSDTSNTVYFFVIFCGSFFTAGISSIFLLVFSLLQFAVSIAISAFACKATASNEPTLNISNVVPDPEGYVSVDNYFPAHHAHPGISAINAVAMPVGSPPAYSEIKSESDS